MAAPTDLAPRLARARFRAWHRGTREADYMIGCFFDRHHASWGEPEIAWYEALLDEVTSLVEWPVVLVGSFEERFLEVPAEPLISTMKDNQKYFPLRDSQGKLLNKFIFVANISSKDPQQIISGNEKVVRPRLSDAQFFFNTDRKVKLAERLDSLKTVLFQQQLGTLFEKSERISLGR